MVASTPSRGPSSWLGAGRRPPRTKSRQTAATAKEAASMAKAGPVLIAAMTRPATAGPRSPDSCCITWTSALAGGSSLSLTIMGTMVFSAGWKKASTTPKMTASTYSCHS